MRFLSSIVGLAVSLASFASATAGAEELIQSAKAAELSCHKLERLLILKKIAKTWNEKLTGGGYNSAFESISVELLAHSQPSEEPAFRVTSTQAADGEGKRNSIDVNVDESGTAMDYKETILTSSPKLTRWPQKDPITIAEESLHFVLYLSVIQPELLPFFRSLSSLGLSPSKNASGAPVGLASIRSRDTQDRLEVLITMDGKCDAYRIVPAGPRPANPAPSFAPCPQPSPSPSPGD
jgi:hypothetical protein